MTLVLRENLNRPLSWQELDGNFIEVGEVANNAVTNSQEAKSSAEQAQSAVAELSTQLGQKQDAVPGFGLSQENFSTADKNKLDSLGPTDLGISAQTGTSLQINSSTGADATLFPATNTLAGLMSAQDKVTQAWQVASGPRDVVTYANATTVRIKRPNVVMGGFRYNGQYTKARGPVFPMAAIDATVDPAGLAGMTVNTKENWYAAFACADDGDGSAQIKVMPFLRVGSVAGSIVTLNKAGEGVHTVQAQTYNWTAPNVLNGVDCLVITEAGGYKGRVTTFTASTNTTVTLATPGALAFGDFILPAPTGFDQYCYLGSFYLDTAEVRNIYDTGFLVRAKMIFVSTPSLLGLHTSPGTAVSCAGYICPLATGVVIDTTSSWAASTSGTGALAEFYCGDSGGHILQSPFSNYVSATTVRHDYVSLAFLYPYSFWYFNGGSGAADPNVSSRRPEITGWYEI